MLGFKGLLGDQVGHEYVSSKLISPIIDKIVDISNGGVQEL
jgi:hypothetical protein